MPGSLPPASELRFGIQAFQQHIGLDGYVALWRRAEKLGLDWASVYDHFLPVFADPNGPSFEGPTLLAALAAQTRSIRCGILVASNTYRHPAVLANVAATIDHVSHGRLELGLGAGWFEVEHRQYGIPFPPIRERLAALREAARVVKSLWTEKLTTFDGRYYTLVDARCEPKPVQRPHPPLWIGGTGERVLLRIVAECADGWNSLPVAEEDYRRLGRALAGHCADLGRDPSDIRRSLIFHTVLGATEAEAGERLRERAAALGIEPGVPGGIGLTAQTAEQCAERLGRYVRLGVSDLVLIGLPPFDERTLELLAREVAPAVRASARSPW